MNCPVGPPELIALRQCWSEWTNLVELFTLRRPARRRVEKERYERLRARLLAACQTLASEGTPAQQAFYQSLEGVVTPWLTPTALERADREILSCLLSWCQAAQQQLWNGRDPAQVRRRRWRILAGMAVVPVVGMVFWLLVSFAPAMLEWLADLGSDLLWPVRTSTARQRWLAGGIALVLGAMWLVSWRQKR